MKNEGKPSDLEQMKVGASFCRLMRYGFVGDGRTWGAVLD